MPSPQTNLWKTILKQQVIVSVQASKGEPLNRNDILEALALSALSGGAAGLRMANTEEENPIGYFKSRHPHIPLIGLSKPVHIPKDAYQNVYITPNRLAIDAIIEAGADIIAMDATLRPRPGGETLAQLVAHCREAAPERGLMADIATLEEGIYAASLGFDLVSTTLSGYTVETLDKARPDEPDFELLQALIEKAPCPVVLEGRVWEPAHVKRAFDLGAFAVVIGSAVTRPQLITQRFCSAR